MLAQSLRSSRASLVRVPKRRMVFSKRTIITPTAARSADLVQSLYLDQLKSFKPSPVKPSDSEGHVQKFSKPKTPPSPEEPGLSSQLNEYKTQTVEVEGQAGQGEAAAPVEEDWFEAEEEDEASPAH